MFAPLLLHFFQYLLVFVFTRFTPVPKVVEKHSHVQQGVQGMQDANLQNRPSNTSSVLTVFSPETVEAAPSGQSVECIECIECSMSVRLFMALQVAIGGLFGHLRDPSSWFPTDPWTHWTPCSIQLLP